MKKPVLALIDSSIYGKTVCELAVWAAKAMDAPVCLLHVLDKSEDQIVLPEDAEAGINVAMRSELIKELKDIDLAKARLAQKLGQMILDEAKGYMERHGVVEVETRLRHDTLLDALDVYAAKSSIIIMGKRGEDTSADVKRLGTNFESVVRSSEKPILVASQILRPIRRVMIAFDGGLLIQRAIDYICGHHLFSDATCIVAMAGRVSKETQGSFERSIAKLRSAGFDVLSYTTDKNPEQMLQEEVVDQNIDMLVMGAFSHSKLRKLFFGSVSQSIILKAKVPVLVMREV
ncbi:universal stress protein [Bartonella sp. LJL80]